MIGDAESDVCVDFGNPRPPKGRKECGSEEALGRFAFRPVGVRQEFSLLCDRCVVLQRLFAEAQEELACSPGWQRDKSLCSRTELGSDVSQTTAGCLKLREGGPSDADLDKG